MKMKRFLALTLSLCMVFFLILPHIPATLATEGEQKFSTSEDLGFTKLDGSKYDVDLTKDKNGTGDLALDPKIDPEESVRVIIVMEGDSIIEENSAAVLNSETEEKVEKLEEDQEAVVAEIEEQVFEGERLSVNYNYTWLLNGVAATVPYRTITEIEAVDGVKKVLVQPVYTVCETKPAPVGDISYPMTVSDGVMIGREPSWAEGYTGKGIKIAVIDTGIDIDHQNFAPLSEDKLTADSATAAKLAAVLGSTNASARYPGLTIDNVYYNTKVAYGFNYCDNDLDITHDNDAQGDHGTHVAGIAAANKAEGSDVVGVAPDAQLYVMKVFGKGGGAYPEDILAALEDALLLDADVVNFSLGSTAGFTTDAEEFNKVYNRVSSTGTILSISAGNSTTMGYGNFWGTNENLTSNPDNGLIGSPGTYANVTTVASVENIYYPSMYISLEGYNMGYSDGIMSDGTQPGNAPLSSLAGNTYDIVVIPNVGEAADFEGLDVAGKIALVQRGSINFSQKCDNAAAAGAVACLVYNSEGGSLANFGMVLDGCTSTIPCALIAMVDGMYIVSAKEANPDAKITIGEGETLVASPVGNQMSDFSSWGVTPDLKLEPDITAPGGNIFSTVNGGQYATMSGTSMAAPNVAGISALVVQYLRENYGLSGEELHSRVNELLMSTAAPLSYSDELLYSPRNQGSGLANAYNAIASKAYLSVEGSNFPKVSLGDDPGKNGSYSFQFSVNNFGTKPLFYTMDTVAQTEGVDEKYAAMDMYFMSSTPMALAANTSESTTSMVLTHDVEDNGNTGSHDAYLIYQAAVAGKPVDSDWADVSFRYNTDGSETVDAADVQAYLDALVGNESPADLTAKVMKVGAGESASVSVSVNLADSDRTYFANYYENGGYVEGFTTLTAMNACGVDLSLPYLAFYGDWRDAPIFDIGYYWQSEEELLYNQYINILFTQYMGEDSGFLPGLNPYIDEAFDLSHISLSPNDDGFADYIDDMYVSLLRNAAELSFTYSDAETGEIYSQDIVQHVSKSYYVPANDLCVPYVYSWDLAPYQLTDAEDATLPNNTKLKLSIAATIDYKDAQPEVLEFPITVDLEAPELLNAKRQMDPDTGKVTLELTFRDNVSTAVVALLNSNGEEVYVMEGTTDPEPDANGYRNYKVSYDITGLTGKIMVVLGDYAFNEAYYGINVAGAGTPYGSLVGYQTDVSNGESGWTSFNPDVDLNETQISLNGESVCSAEYVNGYVFAQTETGTLYGFPYEDMLADSMDIESTFIAQLDNIYQDLAFNYADGNLYGLTVVEDEWGLVSYLNCINIKGDYLNDWGETVKAYSETNVTEWVDLCGMTLAFNDAGDGYVLGMDYDWETESLGETAQLYRIYLQDEGWYSSWYWEKVADTGVAISAFLQSATWDHNTETMYWARFCLVSFSKVACELMTVDPQTGECVKVGTLSGETCAMFAPLSAEAAAMDAHKNVPTMDPNVIGTPVLRDETVTMNVGGTYTMGYDLSPWYTNHKDVVWSSSDESIATVDSNGVVTAVAAGSVTITVANKDDTTKLDTCTIQITALDLKLEGIIATQADGINSVSSARTYSYTMVDGVPTFADGTPITASEDLNFGLQLSTSAFGRGSIWASEYGNVGMIYEIDPVTGAVKDALEPLNGSHLFGLSYSETTDTFAAIMNMDLFIDVPMTHADKEEMLNSYNEELGMFTWHWLDMLPYLLESNTGFVTNETGSGASSEIVMCGITTIEGGKFYEDTYKDYMGNWAMGGSVSYQPTQTLVIVDNVGRLWYIDEVTNMISDGEGTYMSADGISMISADRKGVMAYEYPAADGGASTYSVFYIRQIVETPLTNMFRSGTMPRITYHFSDIEYAGMTEDGDPMFVLSLYDYWNEGTTNELYLYIPGHETEEMDMETYEPIRTPDRLYSLGNTGKHNIIATIHKAQITGGVNVAASGDGAGRVAEVNSLAAKTYKASKN